MRASKLGVRWQLTGTASFVIDGHTADLILLAADSDERPTLFAVEDPLQPDDTNRPDARWSAPLGLLTHAMLASELIADEVAVFDLLSQGDEIPAALVGEIVDELLLIDVVPAEMAVTARALISAACAAADANRAAERSVESALGLLADPPLAASLGDRWVLERLRWALDRHVVPVGDWYVARLMLKGAADGFPGAGDMCTDLARLLAPPNHGATAELLAAAAASCDAAWAGEVLSALSTNYGPAWVSEAASGPIEG
ncbi:MAG TPA: hypothetical protein VHW74_02495 [Mycobacteriales bacterium]|jgi:hypothetical protein|nr:hypothetical protein [Mycobacteriales bacterium]